MQGIASEINKMKRPSLFDLRPDHLSRIYLIGDQLQKDARNWISPPDPSKNYNIASEIYQTGTGLWFFQGGVFSEWCSKGTLLWIHGKRACTSVLSMSMGLMCSCFIAGSGKTILLYVSSRRLCLKSMLRLSISSAIIRDIDRLCAAGLALMAYYYFDFRDTDKQIAVDYSPLSFASSAPSPILAMTFCLAYIQITLGGHESLAIVRLRSVSWICSNWKGNRRFISSSTLWTNVLTAPGCRRHVRRCWSFWKILSIMSFQMYIYVFLVAPNSTSEAS
jgi:hypothetical protein